MTMTEEQARASAKHIVSKTFRNIKGSTVVEKVFVDHDAKPPRAYPTGEFYELLGKTSKVKGLDGIETRDMETITLVLPEDFDFYTYKRTSDIPKGCVIQEKNG